ncbi:glutamate mutase L, partial [Eubacteriales bacterium OttesenSCG-928-N13]|nr:glutamate mutase L [Eubacteriales bacterium OttesenSCG-928-N13]
QLGKDLTRTKQLILTGGALIRSGQAKEMALCAMRTTDYPNSLMPRDAQVSLDERYILSAMGVLSTHHPELARTMMVKEFG